jgi:hypothetical protein
VRSSIETIEDSKRFARVARRFPKAETAHNKTTKGRIFRSLNEESARRPPTSGKRKVRDSNAPITKAPVRVFNKSKSTSHLD